MAGAVAALDAGATHVQGTVNGYGERTGNCNLTSVIPIVHYKLKKTGVPAKSLPKIFPANSSDVGMAVLC